MTRHLESPLKDAEPDEASFAGRALDSKGWTFGPPLRCPPPEMLRAAKEGVLPDDAQALVTTHLEHCRVCQLLAEALDDPSVAGITNEEHARVGRAIRTGIGKAHPAWTFGSIWRWSPVPAVLAAIVLVLTVAWLILREPTPPPALVRGPQPATPGHTPTPSAFTLEKAAVRLPAAAVILWRGEKDADPEGSARDLAAALEPYGRDDFADAAQRLTVVAGKHPANAAAHFYLGVSDLFLQRDAEAITALETAKRLAGTDQVLADDVAWYLAVAFQRIGRHERAAGELRPVCDGKGPLAARACAGLIQLALPRSTAEPR